MLRSKEISGLMLYHLASNVGVLTSRETINLTIAQRSIRRGSTSLRKQERHEMSRVRVLLPRGRKEIAKLHNYGDITMLV